MIRGIGASTRVLALLGDPVDHSLSPAMQNAALREAGRDAVYVALRCGPEELPGLLTGLAWAGGGGNVTLPHKELAAQVLDRPDEVVKRTGACNTFWLDEGRVRGDNTDVEGLRRALEAFLEGSGAGRRILLLGAGGAARAALTVLLAMEPEEIVVFNRTKVRARTLVDRLGDETTRVVGGPEELEGSRFDLLVNATRLGLDPGDELPFDPGGSVRVERVMDLVYRPGETALVGRASELGIPAVDGREMLLHQGAAAYERWWGEPPSLAAMRRALHEATNP